MKSYVLILIAFVFISGKQQDSITRTQFFPKAEQRAKNIPTKDKIWVFILAGQSNMAGRGLVEPQDTVPSERILTINRKGEIIAAKEPLHFYEPSRTGLDCGLSFGKELIKRIPQDISVIIIPAAVGGSSVSQWLGDSIYRNVQLLTNFREKAEIGKKYGQIKGILWHQGETDATQNRIPLYKNRLSQLFEKFRAISGNENLPILIGELGSYSTNNESWMKINEQIQLYVFTDRNAMVVETSDLKGIGDNEHFNSEGQRELGYRFADKYLQNLK